MLNNHERDEKKGFFFFAGSHRYVTQISAILLFYDM